MKIYDIVLALYIFNLIANMFNATIFLAVDSYNVTVLGQQPIQGLNASGVDVAITDFTDTGGNLKETGWLESLWTGVVMSATAIGFLFKLFIYPSGITTILTKMYGDDAIYELFVEIFGGAMSIIIAFCLYMLIFNRNSKWME